MSWPSNISSVKLYLNTQNSIGLSAGTVTSEFANSLSQWSTNLPFTVQVNDTASEASNGKNDVFFSSNSLYFSDSSVVGVTQVSYKEGSGDIIEADIIINNSISTPSTNHESYDFIGNILTHELGHFFGLGHSQHLHSTMFYKLNYGQYLISEEDISSVKSIYYSSYYPAIKGKIVGSKNLYGVFGANVQAISLSKGKIAGTAISDTDGSFAIDGLTPNDNYILYVKPLNKLDSLPSYFQTVRSDFCEGRTKYRGNTFSTCFTEDQGNAQIISLQNSTDVDVGNVSIGCNLEVSTAYLQEKSSSSGHDVSIVKSDGSVGLAMTGFFSTFDAVNGVTDKLNFDLRNITLPGGQIYLETKIIYHSLFSPLKLGFNLSRTGISSQSFPTLTHGVVIDSSDNSINFDSSGRILLDSSVASNNKVTLTITPTLMSDYLIQNSLIYTMDDIYPASDYFMDDHGFYILTANLVQFTGGAYVPVKSILNSTIYDNKKCPQGTNTYTVSAGKSSALLSSSSGKKKEEDKAALACGSIDLDSGSGPRNGMIFLISFALGFFAIFSKNLRLLRSL